MQDLGFHRFANIYPLLEATQLAELASSIKAHGLREAIVLHSDGSILDGRNRYLACRTAGVPPRFVNFGGSDNEALEFVVDTNSRRRHLDASQRALVAARLVGYGHGGSRTDQQKSDLLTHKDAAHLLNVGERSVRDGKLVVDYGSDAMSDEVEKGLLAVRAAAEIIRAAGKDRALVAEYHRLRRQSRSVEWYTPKHILNLVIDVLGEIDLDPASNQGDPWVPAKKHFTVDDDGLAQEWSGRVYLNPPWDSQGSPRAWVTKLVHEYQQGQVTQAICLLPARTNTEWMGMLAPYPRVYVRGRLRFSDGAGEAPFPVMLVYLGVAIGPFARSFSTVGDVFASLQAKGVYQ
jgi:hypothetical protein